MRGASHRRGRRRQDDIAIEVGVLLTRHGIAHAVIDLDWMSWDTPSFDGDAANHRRELLVENLRAVWRNYERHGVRRVVPPAASPLARIWRRSGMPSPTCRSRSCASA